MAAILVGVTKTNTVTVIYIRALSRSRSVLHAIKKMLTFNKHLMNIHVIPQRLTQQGKTPLSGLYKKLFVHLGATENFVTGYKLIPFDNLTLEVTKAWNIVISINLWKL